MECVTQICCSLRVNHELRVVMPTWPLELRDFLQHGGGDWAYGACLDPELGVPLQELAEVLFCWEH